MIEKIKKRGIDLKFKLITTSMLAFILFTGMGLIEDVQAAESLEDKKQNVQENLSEVEKDILKTSEKVNELNEKIEILEAAISSNEQDLEDEKENKKLESGIVERNEILKARSSDYQNTGGDLGYLEAILGSAGFEDFISRITAVTTITQADNELIEEQKKSMEKVEEKEEQVNEKLAEAEQTKEKLANIAKVKKDQKSDLEDSVKSVEKEQENLKDKKASYVKEGNDIEALEEKVNAIKQAKEEKEANQESGKQ